MNFFLILSQAIDAFGATGTLSLYLLLHLVIGLLLPSRGAAEPLFFAWVRQSGLELERRLNRENRPKKVRFIRGVVIAVLMSAVALVVASTVRRLAASFPEGWIVLLAFMSLCINFTAPLKLVRRLRVQLHANQVAAAAETLQGCVGMPLDQKDSHAVIRRAVEWIASALNRFLVAPSFWFLAAGPLGVSFYVVFSALDSAFGLPDPRRIQFGRAVRTVHLVMNVVPSFLTAFLLCLSALFVSKSNPLRAIMTLAGQSTFDAPYMAAMAGGLGVTLGGPVRYSADYTVEQAWVGPKGSSARLSAGDLARASMIQGVCFVVLMAGLSGILVMGKLFPL